MHVRLEGPLQLGRELAWRVKGGDIGGWRWVRRQEHQRHWLGTQCPRPTLGVPNRPEEAQGASCGTAKAAL